MWLDNLLDKVVFLSYSRVGYALRQPWWSDDSAHVDMSGKICLITGANVGLGFATAEQLARQGATVIMVARHQAKGEAAQAEVIARTGNSHVFLEQADISSLASVKALAARLYRRYPQLDVPIHNAGVLLDTHQQSVDGLELTFATNVLGPFYLTYLLTPLLQATTSTRVIWVSSGGMYTQQLNLKALQTPPSPFNGVTAYAQTKRAQVILSELWAEKLAPLSINVNAMHPGWAATPGLQSSLPTFTRLMNRLLRTPAQGADTIVWLAVAPSINRTTGLFWFDRRPRPTHMWRGTTTPHETRTALWTTCLELCDLNPNSL